MKIAIIIVGLIILFKCGKEETKYKKIPYGGDKPSSISAWDIVKANCVSCHATQAPVFTNKDQMIAAKAGICKVINAGSMPPSGPLEAEKSDIIKKDLCT